MEEHFCDVGIYRASHDCLICSDNGAALVNDCENCRIGCFKPAKFRNPNYDLNAGIYRYAEWLCAEHYDVVMHCKDNSDE